MVIVSAQPVNADARRIMIGHPAIISNRIFTAVVVRYKRSCRNTGTFLPDLRQIPVFSYPIEDSPLKKILVALVLMTAATFSFAETERQAPAVVVEQVSESELQQAFKLVGRIEAAAKVDLLARVTGFLEERLFTEGTLVEAGKPLERVYNLGSGDGLSVRQIMTAMANVTGIDFEPEIGPRRAGDPDRIVADGTLAARDLDWKMRHSVEQMVASAYDAQRHAITAN